VLSSLAEHARDWFDMTDELRYERLAISIARTHSLTPRVHGVDIHSLSQLYPLLIAPLFTRGLVPHDLHDAHVLNGWVMSSACIPVYFLARRVTRGEWQPLLAAFLSVCIPWSVYSTMLMTENAAYPAFLWAVLAVQHTLARPSRRADALALLALAVAFFARTELLVLVFVAPVAVILLELGRVPIRRVVPVAVRAHPLAAVAYLALSVAGVVLWHAHRLAEVVGVYGVYAQKNQLLPAGFFGSFAEHLAMVALGLGVLPVVAGGAWLAANVVRAPREVEAHAFACTGAVAVVALLVQATNFDVRYTGYVHDRFLLYLAPLFTIATLRLLEARPPLWAFALPAAVVAAGFAFGAFPAFTWSQFPQLTPDSPVSKLLEPLTHLTGSLGGARVLLVAATLVATGLLAAVGGRRIVRVLIVVLVVGLSATTTIFTFRHFFDTKDWALRPVSASEAGVFDWIDETLGTRANVSMVPYPVNTNYFISEQFWRDLEFWNVSVDRDVHFGSNVYEYTGIWFPKLYATVDPATGRFSASPTRWVAQSDKETRFGIAGPVRADDQDVLLIDAGKAWRASWVTSGLYDDGWTRPRVTARIRIFPAPGQQRREIRFLTILIRPPTNVKQARVVVTSNLQSQTATATPTTGTAAVSIRVCVPPTRFTEVRLKTPLVTSIPGDTDNLASTSSSRRGGVYLASIALAGETGGPCRVRGASGGASRAGG
jgi:hypothetical protein